jgi:uncharacterized SAM-binding protein YcdF (DUF218 family)
VRKLLTEPLLLFLLVQIFLALRLKLKKNFDANRDRRRISNAVLISVLVLWLISNPFTVNLFERFLELPETRESSVPVQAIAVLGGGYIRMKNPHLDFLSGDTTARVLYGVDWWQKYPQAKIIFTGASAKDADRPTDKEVTLMNEMALRYKVPKEKIILEPTATDTSKHPTAILAIPGFTPDTPIGVVTSPWHLRRAVKEFRRHFKVVVPISYAGEKIDTDPWSDWIARRSSLAYSTTLYHEILGLIWYDFCSIFGHSP